MNQFAAYATSTAFSISLSKAMVNALFLVMKCEEGSQEWHGYKDHFGGDTDLWTVAVKGLIRRGLVVHNEPKIIKSGPNKGYADYSKPPFTMTAAGRHIFELCKLAELVPTSRIISFRDKRAA